MTKYFDLLTKGIDNRIIKMSVCKFCSNEFPLYSNEKKIYDKHGFEYSTQCSLCTFRMLNSYINDRHLYIREDSEDSKKIVSVISDSFKGKVLEANKFRNYLTDDYAFKYGVELDEGSIINDFKDLYNDFPKPSRLIFPELYNGEYSSHTGWAKNVYLSYCIFTDCEDVYYSFRVVGGCKDIFDSYNIYGCRNLYSSRNIGSSQNINFCDTIVNSSSLFFCREMNNCSECIFCCNQVNQKYMIFNVNYSKEEYQKIKNDILNRIKDYKQFKFLNDKYDKFLEKKLILQSRDTNRCENVFGETT